MFHVLVYGSSGTQQLVWFLLVYTLLLCHRPPNLLYSVFQMHIRCTKRNLYYTPSARNARSLEVQTPVRCTNTLPCCSR